MASSKRTPLMAIETRLTELSLFFVVILVAGSMRKVFEGIDRMANA